MAAPQARRAVGPLQAMKALQTACENLRDVMELNVAAVRDAENELRKELQIKTAELETAREAFESEKAAMTKMVAGPADVVVLNVSGKEMQVQRSTLCCVTGSLLEAMFSGRWEEKLPRDSQNRIFLDFNACCFEMVVDCLRSARWNTGLALDVRVPDELRPMLGHLVRYLGLESVIPQATWATPTLVRFIGGHGHLVSPDGRRVIGKDGSTNVMAVLSGPGHTTGKHLWDVRILTGSRHFIGIIPVPHIPVDSSVVPYIIAEKQWPRYMLLFDTEQRTTFPISLFHKDQTLGVRRAKDRTNAPNTIISVELDCDARTVKFRADYGPPFTCPSLDMSKPWTLFCILEPGNCSVELMT